MSQQQNTQNQAIQPQQIYLNTKTQFYDNQTLKQSKVHSVVSHSSSPQNLLKYFQQYQPMSTYIKQQIQTIHKSQNLKLKKYKQSVYYGQFINHKRQGKGIMIYDNNRLYQGDWQCDYKHGKGYEKFQNQAVYIGDYLNGKPQGVGKYLWPNGEFYQGQWSNGMKHGSGMWKGSKGDSYIGEWRHGKADGYGVHTWINGDRYQGQFKQCLKHGQGIQKFKNGDIYKGFYINGKPQGFGQYYWQNGSYFKGQFKNGYRNGHGIWKRNHGNSDKYQGQYKNDKKQGYGIFNWSTGNVYKGNYQNDARNGFGQMYWSDGSWYKGNWKNGIQDGQGQIYIPGQMIKKGVFQDNYSVIGGGDSRSVYYTNNQQSNRNTPHTYNHSNKHNHNININNLQKLQKQSNYSNAKYSTNSKQKTNLMPSKIQFRTINSQSRQYKNNNKSRQPKSLDQNIVIRYGNPTVQIPYNNNYNTYNNTNNKYNSSKNTRNIQHPLLPKKLLQKRQQKYITFQRSLKNQHKQKLPITRQQQRQQYLYQQNHSQQQQRVLHSAFYMHQFHNRATTSIHASRAQVKYGYSSSLEYGRGELGTRQAKDRDQVRRKDSKNDEASVGFSQKRKMEKGFDQKQRIEDDQYRKEKDKMDMIQQIRYYNKMRISKNARTPNF